MGILLLSKVVNKVTTIRTMTSVWKLAQSLAVSTIILGSNGVAFALPQVNSSPIAQTPETSASKRQLDPRTNISFESQGCTRRGNVVTCEVISTNFNNMHRRVHFGASFEKYPTRVVDPKGNVFVARSVNFNNVQRGSDRVTIDLAPGVPTRLVFLFQIPQTITEISAIDIGYLAISRIDVLSRTTLTNVGSISAAVGSR